MEKYSYTKTASLDGQMVTITVTYETEAKPAEAIPPFVHLVEQIESIDPDKPRAGQP